MPFDVRCPSCQAKLRFDDPPKRGTEIECGKCGQKFAAPSANAFEEKKVDQPKKEEKGKPKKKPKTVEAVPRTYFNHWLLLLIVGSLMGVIITLFTVIWVIVARSAKAEDMVACVPDSFNVMRGVNLKSLRNYPGVKANGDKFYDADAQAVYDEAAKKVGLGKDDLAYFVCAREVGSNSVLYLFGTTPYFKPADLGDGNPIVLSRGVVVTAATPNLIIAASGRNANGHVSAAAQNARSKPRDGMHTKIGTAGKLAIRGQIWSVFRETGALKGWLTAAAGEFKEDGTLTKLREGMSKATVLSTWVSFGTSGVRLAAAMELPEASDATTLVADMKQGPLGKADESEPPNGFKKALSQVANVSQNGAFWQYLEYRQSGSCAMAVSRVEDPDKANNLIGEFIHANRATGGGGGGFGR
ncbi:MAG: zinc-ribbon domain-containing protein [Fimbriiglobus sp.]|jgi:hypothetical protein|nr:zinc-ribbon domain-containing protein [Fimbriiglobus sp.]